MSPVPGEGILSAVQQRLDLFHHKVVKLSHQPHFVSSLSAMNPELHDDHIEWCSAAADPEKLGSYEVELNDSMSSFESVGSWMAQPRGTFIGRTAIHTPPQSPTPVISRPTISNRNFAANPSPMHTPKWNKIREESTLTPSAACASPCNSSFLGISPGRPPRPPLLKKRSRRGILRSARTSSRQSLLSSRSSHSGGSLTPSSTTPSSGGRQRNRSFRHRRRHSPYKVEKRVTFCLPDDTSVGSSVSGSLLLCDVETMDSSIHTDHWATGEEFGNQSCRIVLPYMDGLDSDDEFALDEEDDKSDEGGRASTLMEDWFNSTSELNCNFHGLNDADSFSGGFQTPFYGKKSGDEESMKNVQVCKSAEPSAVKSMIEMQTPVAKGLPTFPVLNDVQETPVASILHSALSELEDEEYPILSTLTPIPIKEEHYEDEKATEGSPTSVLESDESVFKRKEDNGFIDNNERSIDLELCTDRLTSIRLGTEDIAVRDMSQRAVTKLIANKINNRSSMVAYPLSAGHATVSSSECRHLVRSRRTVEKVDTIPARKVLESIPGSKPSTSISSPIRRASLGHPLAASPLTRTFTMSPIGRMKVHHAGRGL
jgi:hypothetical protein